MTPQTLLSVTQTRNSKCAVCRARMLVERSTRRTCSTRCRVVRHRRLKKRSAVFSSKNQCWQTPAVVLDRVRLVAPIALDPCGGRGSLVRAAVELYEDETDGLARSWNVGAEGIAFMNPPYGGAQAQWLAKAAAELEHIDTIALVASRPGTKWWFETVAAKASLVCLWRGRITFLGATTPSAFESAIILYSQDPQRQERFRAAFGDVGRVVVP